MTMPRLIDLVMRLLNPIADLRQMRRGISGFPLYLRDWRAYTRLPNVERLQLFDALPQLHDRTNITPVDAHYFYGNGWCMRRVIGQHPTRHIDIGSQVVFANLLASVVPVMFVDRRPLHARLNGLMCLSADILRLPFADGSLESLSCLHVVEHIGLGRYGDALNPSGTRQSCAELARVLAPGGNLFLSTPVGKPRVCFNAHRIHAPRQILEFCIGLSLVEFSAVDDNGQFVSNAGLEQMANAEYGCGLFWFQRG